MKYNNDNTYITNRSTMRYTENNIKPLNEYFGTEVDLEWANKYADELDYIYENHYDLGDWDGWYCVEELLQKKISFDDYRKINAELWEDNIDTIGIDSDYTGEDRIEMQKRIELILIN